MPAYDVLEWALVPEADLEPNSAQALVEDLEQDSGQADLEQDSVQVSEAAQDSARQARAQEVPESLAEGSLVLEFQVLHFQFHSC